MATNNKKDSITTEYIQFSKQVTRWGIALVSIAFLLCLGAITFFSQQIESIGTVSSIYTAYITIMGVTIGAYQGNSSLEKWSKAKYQYDDLVKTEEE